MWEERFRRLSEWKKNHGHCAVPIAQGELGTWVSKQRQLRKRGKLSKEKIDALDSLNFTWSTAEADWEDKFKRLCAWTRERGHASVPFNEGELGWWVNTQRQCKRKGKLSPSREFRLQSLGFVWNPSNSRSRNTKPANLTSSADTTPTSTPEKPENFLCEVDSNNRILQLLGSGIASCTNENKEELLMFEDNPPPVSAEKLGIEMTPPRHPIIEPLTSPLHAPLTHHLWSPTILNPPLHNEGAMLGFSMPQCLHTHSSLDDLHPFGLTGTRQCQTDVLEQLLARDDACALYHSNIDPLHCEENL